MANILIKKLKVQSYVISKENIYPQEYTLQ